MAIRIISKETGKNILDTESGYSAKEILTLITQAILSKLDPKNPNLITVAMSCNFCGTRDPDLIGNAKVEDMETAQDFFKYLLGVIIDEIKVNEDAMSEFPVRKGGVCCPDCKAQLEIAPLN